MARATSMLGLAMRSRITAGGQLELWLEEAPTREPGPDEVVIRVEAAPINPSDMGLLFGPADLSTLRSGGTSARPTVVASVPPSRMAGVTGRLNQALAVGNEGAGIVVIAGSDLQHYIGRTAATQGGMYTRYRVVKASECVVFPPGTTPRQAASAYVNPLTALGMVETMRREGHTALVHTAAASNLGQMLQRLCRAEAIPLVNIVRSPEQASTLRQMGATHVLDSTTRTFAADLTDAVAETQATLAFDAVGGGSLAATILASMEAAARRRVTMPYSRYGTTVQKQVYIYGGLDPRPTTVDRTFGMAWGIGGWLVAGFVESIGAVDAQRLRDRIAAELTTTFASRYAAEISMEEALSPVAIAAYTSRATGKKYLMVPNKNVD